MDSIKPVKKVVILGGGFAGLACATALAEAGVSAVVLEKKPFLGGRAYSFREPKTGEMVDNGQHLFMGCYRETRSFLRRIATEHLLRFPSSIRIDYADAEGRRDALRCSRFLPAPLHLAWGVLRLSSLSLKDKTALWRLDWFMRKYIWFQNGKKDQDPYDQMTVRQWLDHLGLSPRLQERLLDPIALGALNEKPEIASAKGFIQVLREIFYRDAESSRLGLVSVDLSALYTEQARRFIEARKGWVLLNRKVSGLVESNGRITEVLTAQEDRFAADAVVSALPPWALNAVVRPPALEGNLSQWGSSPILGINLWLEEPLVQEPVVGLIGTEVHWIFNKTRLWDKTSSGQYLSLVVSGAHEHVKRSPEELLALAERDLSRCFPGFRKEQVRASYVVKEPYATPSPVPGSDALRPAHRSPIHNFFYAGDWTQTGLPATIESAVKSGHACAEAVLLSHVRRA